LDRGYAATPSFSSEYTETEKCQSIEDLDEDNQPHGDGHMECTGPADYYLVESYSALSDDRSIQHRIDST
jgi:hypothetical protein